MSMVFVVAKREVVLPVSVEEDAAPEVGRLERADEGFGELADGLAGETRAHLFLHHVGELDDIVAEVRAVLSRERGTGSDRCETAWVPPFQVPTRSGMSWASAGARRRRPRSQSRKQK